MISVIIYELGAIELQRTLVINLESGDNTLGSVCQSADTLLPDNVFVPSKTLFPQKIICLFDKKNICLIHISM